MKTIGLIILFMTGIPAVLWSQEFQLDKLGKEKWLKYQGSLSASGMWYEGSGNRDPFGYLLRGQLQFTLGGIYSIPLSFTYSDQQFRAPSPLRFNRLSIRPSYKNFRLYLGDAAISFMPYTLNGHQFTGAGLEWQPASGLSASVMYGRLLKPVAYSPDAPMTPPVLGRKGYGALLGYTSSGWHIKSSAFFAADEVPDFQQEVLRNYPFPEENRVWGIQAGFSLLRKGQLILDLGTSQIGLQKSALDRYGLSADNDSIARTSRSTHHAFKAEFKYPVSGGSLGAVYERIDPGYRTFGTYFFNADLENLHIAASQVLFKGKVSLALRSGVQRDNLDNTGRSEFKQFTNAFDLRYTPKERMSFRSSYSNFQSFTNSRDQFDQINNTDARELLDTLSYRQVSEQAGLAFNYQLRSREEGGSALSAMVNYQGNRESGGENPGNRYAFYQGNVNYRVTRGNSGLSYGVALNASHRNGQGDQSFTAGPGIDISKPFLSRKLHSRLALAYNQSRESEGEGGGIFTARANASYRISPRQGVTLTGIYQYRSTTPANAQEVSVQLNYHYRLDNFKLYLDPAQRSDHAGKSLPVTLHFRYREVAYSGTIPQVNRQIALVSGGQEFSNLPPAAMANLKRLRTRYLEQTKKGAYKFHALHYLAALYRYGDVLESYYRMADKVVRKVRHDMQKVDLELERRYVRSYQLLANNMSGAQEALSSTDLHAIWEETSRRLKAHRWMEQQLLPYPGMEDKQVLPSFLRSFLDANLQDYFQKLEQGIPAGELMGDYEVALIDHCYRWSLQYIKNAVVVQRYHHLKLNTP